MGHSHDRKNGHTSHAHSHTVDVEMTTTTDERLSKKVKGPFFTPA